MRTRLQRKPLILFGKRHSVPCPKPRRAWVTPNQHTGLNWFWTMRRPGLVTVDLQIANQFLDFVDFYVTSNRSSHIEKYRDGARVPWEERVSQGRYPLLRLDFAPEEEKTIFIRVQSQTPLRVPLDLCYRRGSSAQRTRRISVQWTVFRSAGVSDHLQPVRLVNSAAECLFILHSAHSRSRRSPFSLYRPLSPGDNLLSARNHFARS